ncbi:MAG: (d)CMP kinase [Ruminococcaceae bacterium]|nr:(d)CMP kinase [Oscillospiraceae bacterium]
MDKIWSVAVDGPSGAGKSSLSRKIAERFGLMYVDTGAIYRTVGLAVHRAGVSPDDPVAVIALLPSLIIDLRHDESGLQRMYLGGEDVTDSIRTPEISQYASKVSAIPEVRAFLMEQQRSLARRYSVIMDGRDIGTVVLPDADIKVFLTASAEDRARRRYEENLSKGVKQSFEEVLADIIERDERDSSRAAAPLRAAEDAVLLDTTGNSFEQSLEQLSCIIKERVG